MFHSEEMPIRLAMSVQMNLTQMGEHWHPVSAKGLHNHQSYQKVVVNCCQQKFPSVPDAVSLDCEILDFLGA